MNKKKALLAMGCSLAVALGCGAFAACGEKKEAEKTYSKDMQGVYAYAQDQGYTGSYEELIAAVKGEKGDKGDAGVGIASIEKTSSTEVSDIYTITFTDNTTKEFTVNHGTEGRGIASMTTEAVADNELATKYTITYTDGSTDSFTIVNGAKGADGEKGDRGVGIKSITEKETGTAEDGSTYVTYTITYTNDDTFDFTVNNGTVGKDGQDGEDGKDGQDGVSITEIVPTVGQDLDGNACTILTIKLSNSTEYQVSIPNGAKGEKGDAGEDGKDGANGQDGKQGVGISSASIATNGDLVFTLTEGEPIVAGNILDLLGTNETKHTVNFGFYFGDDEIDEADAYTTVTVRDGGKLVDPLFGEGKESILAAIENDAYGYEADGWYYVYNGELVKWNFYGYSVTEDMNLFYIENIEKKISYDLTYSGLEGANVYGKLPATYVNGDPLPNIAAYKLETKTEGEGDAAVEKKYVSVFAGWTDADGNDVTGLSFGDKALTAKWRTVEYGHSDVENLATKGIYAGTEANVIISGDDITTINTAFYNNAVAKNIYVIAPNLTTFGHNNAFKQMKACENVVIVSDALTAGKANFFQNSTALKNVALECPNMEKLSGNTFSGCTALETVKLPEACTVWGSNEFANLVNFDVVANFGWDYLNKLTAIGSGTFSKNETFTEIRIDATHFASLETYNGMFSNNPNVESIHIETYAEVLSFYLNGINSKKIDSIYFHAPLTKEFKVGLNNTYANSVYVYAPMATSLGTVSLQSVNVDTLIVTDDVTAMPQANAAVYVVGALQETGQLANNSSIKKAVYDVASLKGISNNAFQNAKQLTTIHIANGKLEKIGGSAFYDCKELRSIVLPEAEAGTQYYSDYYQYNDTYNYAGIQNTFRGTSKLQYLSNYEAFEKMFGEIDAGSYGSSFAFDAPVFAPDTNGYNYCGNTLYKANVEKVKGDIVIPANVTKIANGAFAQCEITSLSFAEGSELTAIGRSAFSGCTSLTSVDFTNATKIASMGEYVFANSYALTSVKLPTNAEFTEIPKYAFSGNVGEDTRVALETIEIPANIKSIGYAAFSCSKLSSFTIADGAQLESVDDYAFQNTWIEDATPILQELADAGLTDLSETWGLFDTNSKLTTVTLPATITKTGGRMFNECGNLATFNFADGTQFQEFDGSEFMGTALTSFTVPAKATNMPSFADIAALETITFAEGCAITELGSLQGTAISSIEIPASVTTLGVFQDCKNLKSVVIPAGVTRIPANAFRYCTALESVTLPAELTRIDNYVFEGCTLLTAIKMEGNESDSNILPATLTQIGSNAFKDTAITNITVPAAVTSLGSSAFQGCKQLTYISLPAGLSYSSANTFADTILDTIVLVKSVKHNAISAGTSATSNFTSRNCGNTPWAVASQQRAVKLVIGTGINKIANYAFNGANASNLTVFLEDGAEIATIGTYNTPYSEATKHIGLNTAWEYNAETGLPQVKAAAEETPEETPVA